MSRTLILFCLTLLICLAMAAIVLAGGPLSPPPIELEPGKDEYIMGDQLALYEDESARLTLAEVIRRDSLFQPSQQQSPNYGPSASAV